METAILIDAGKARIKLPESFNKMAQNEFRKSYAPVLADAAVKVIEVDFSDVEYIDSSALGSLLLLRDGAQKAAQTVSIVQCRAAVMKILAMAHFHRIFDIQ